MPGFAYTTEVNKGSMNMRWLTDRLTQMGQQGWRLHTIFEQDRNTVISYERPTRSDGHYSEVGSCAYSGGRHGPLTGTPESGPEPVSGDQPAPYDAQACAGHRPPSETDR